MAGKVQTGTKRVQTEMCLELAGSKYPMDVIRKYVKDVVATKFSDVKKIGIYIQPETNMIYYTVNGAGSPEYCFLIDDLDALCNDK